MNLSLLKLHDATIKTTTSLCPLCHRAIAARVFERSGQVFQNKTCPEHGEFEVLVSSDRRFYYDSIGARGECCGGACSPAPASTAERASTCIALIEIVESCNLRCPTCYADAPFGVDDQIKALPLDEFWQRINSVIARKGNLDILQLSGGEPTLHPRFFELLAAVQTDPRIGYTLLTTNGVRLAHDQAFMRELGELHRARRRFEVYLQFDGPQESGQTELRGADLRKTRLEAVAHCGQWGIPVSLAMTVTPDNLAHLGQTMELGLSHPTIRGITFQPVFASGRTTLSVAGVQQGPTRHRAVNVADIVLGLIEQSGGLLCERDFTPLPCGDPNCHTIGYVLRRGAERVPVSRLVDFASMRGFLKDRLNFNVHDLERCGCESQPLGRLLKQLEIGPDDVFRLMVKPFMDGWTYDQDRIDRCCVHVVGEGGSLDSFCRHYASRGRGR